MKKSLSLFAKALTLFVAFSFVSCSDDDKESNNNNNNGNQTIVGSWVYNGYYNQNGTYVADDTNPCWSFTITFNADGTGNDVDRDCEEGDETMNFDWESKGNNAFTLTYPDMDPQNISVAFTSNNQIDVTLSDGSKERFTKK